MSRLRFVVLAFALLALAPVGCGSNHAKRAHAEAERAHAEAERARLEAELAAMKQENAKLRAELEEANKLLGRNVIQKGTPAPPK